jgi:hypothetical protein
MALTKTDIRARSEFRGLVFEEWGQERAGVIGNLMNFRLEVDLWAQRLGEKSVQKIHPHIFDRFLGNVLNYAADNNNCKE